jgi:hypothetical protein
MANAQCGDYRAQFFEGNRLLAAGDYFGAAAAFRRALAFEPNCAAARANLGLALERDGKTNDADNCYRRAIALDWRQAQTHINRGALLARAKRFDEAEAAYLRANLLAPDSPVPWSNLGVLYACMHRDLDAEQCYLLALRNDPGYGPARFNLSYIQLRQGRFAEGWQSLEARDWYAPLARQIGSPRWRGEALAGKSVLIGYEAGHGDMIQFGRYAAVLKARGATRVGILCHPALKTLFGTLDGIDEVTAFDETLSGETWDCWTPPLSIPYYCETRLESIPATVPYLHATPERIAKWEPRMPRAGLRVGLAWKGSPQFENDADRSLPSLDLLAPLGSVSGASFVSLQKGAGEAEAARPPTGLELVDLGSKVADFADTAAIIAGLDLVIAVDTAVAHLAGALGKPCWVMLPYYKTDWRWLKDRDDSPWYPRMRLFRQSAMGDWNSVVAEIKAALQLTARPRRAQCRRESRGATPDEAPASITSF